jgi:hypothetical protein
MLTTTTTPSLVRQLDRALCAGSPVPDLWFAPEGTEAAETAQRICVQCPAIQACAEVARANRASDGIWAGELLSSLGEGRRNVLMGQPTGRCGKGHDLSQFGRWANSRPGRKRCMQCERDRNLTRRVGARSQPVESTETQTQEAC